MQQWLPQKVTFMSCMKKIRQISMKEKTRKELPIENQTISINASVQHIIIVSTPLIHLGYSCFSLQNLACNFTVFVIGLCFLQIRSDAYDNYEMIHAHTTLYMLTSPLI